VRRHKIGAALGRQFSHELIRAVATMPQAQLDDAMARASERRNDVRARYSVLRGVHLLSIAAYGTLRGPRQQLHAWIAKGEAKLPPSCDRDVLLAQEHPAR
jgi:hypothetical protein